jgi:hypothetical protein
MVHLHFLLVLLTFWSLKILSLLIISFLCISLFSLLLSLHTCLPPLFYLYSLLVYYRIPFYFPWSCSDLISFLIIPNNFFFTFATIHWASTQWGVCACVCLCVHEKCFSIYSISHSGHPSTQLLFYYLTNPCICLNDCKPNLFSLLVALGSFKATKSSSYIFFFLKSFVCFFCQLPQ